MKRDNRATHFPQGNNLMKPARSRFPQIVSATLLLGLGTACCGTGDGWSAEPATIPLPSLPQNSRLAIWGDSITELTLYPRFVEMYLLACAGRKDVKVCMFGHSGERMAR